MGGRSVYAENKRLNQVRVGGGGGGKGNNIVFFLRFFFFFFFKILFCS